MFEFCEFISPLPEIGINISGNSKMYLPRLYWLFHSLHIIKDWKILKIWHLFDSELKHFSSEIFIQMFRLLYKKLRKTTIQNFLSMRNKYPFRVKSGFKTKTLDETDKQYRIEGIRIFVNSFVHLKYAFKKNWQNQIKELQVVLSLWARSNQSLGVFPTVSFWPK